MNYFEFHIGDYAAATQHLSDEEDLAYRRLLDVYYRDERPIPGDLRQACRLARARTDAMRAAVETVLQEFFTLTPDGWRSKRADEGIARHHAFLERQRANGRASAAKRSSNAGSTVAEPPLETKAAPVEPPSNGGSTVGQPPTSHFPLPTSHSEEGRDLTLLPVPSVVERERSTGADVERVFAHWQREHNHPHSKLDAKRRTVIARALKAYPADVLCRSISGYRNSPHHMGQNDRSTRYDSIELFLRDAAHVDAGLKFADNEAPHAPATRFGRTVAHLNRLIAEAEREELAALEGPDVGLRPALGG